MQPHAMTRRGCVCILDDHPVTSLEIKVAPAHVSSRDVYCATMDVMSHAITFLISKGCRRD
jgi:hypothetical protein